MLRKLAIAPFLVVSLTFAQSPAPKPAPDPNTQFMEEVMHTAEAVHGLVKSMNLQKALGAGTVYPPGDPRSLQRTADFMGVGAGVGMALGEMLHNPHGGERNEIIGAAAGGAGGLLVDQLLRRQAEKSQPAPAGQH